MDTIPSDDAMLLETRRLELTPIRGEHAELYQAVRDPAKNPLTLEQARGRCERWAGRQSPDGHEIWLNWIAIRAVGAVPVAHVQGEVVDQQGTMAWSTAVSHRNLGYATEAGLAVLRFMVETFPVLRVTANIHESNAPSNRVASKLGMTLTTELRDGERVWAIDRA